MNTSTPAQKVRISTFGKLEVMLALMICLITTILIGYKVVVLGYTMASLEQEEGYFVRLQMDVTGNGRNCEIKATLPVSSDRQIIRHEKQTAEEFKYTISPGRIGRWYAENYSGSSPIVYSFLAQTTPKEFRLPVDEEIPTTYTLRLESDLIADDKTQTNDPVIVAKALELAPEGTDLTTTIKNIYNYCLSDIKYLEVKGPTDALTALRLGEASCNGKVRLMIAMLRSKNIPARLANGLILERSRKRTTHAWVEVWVKNEWIPFCPTNDYFASIPEKYLELAKGDVAVLTRSRSIGFDWKWQIRHQLSTREKAVLSNIDHPLNILRTWMTMKDYRVSLDLIMIILLIPVGATVVAFFRNVIGVVPFGTFMPALVAVSFRETGFLFGAIMFTTVLLVATGVNLLLVKLRLLHIPRLTIIITVVVLSILGVSVFCIRMGIAQGAAVSLFPMAILSLTSERFTQTIMVDGLKEAAKRLLVTFVVSSACYLVIGISALQMLVVAYPELLLVNIAINLVLGSWTGMRLSELGRFKDLPMESV
ncbi:MAG: 7TM domain-containing protein [Candidatus Sumerlaeia bacterium]|nr:7TM domain-containing protein [Candidatus Sumerlaeia bacterium]